MNPMVAGNNGQLFGGGMFSYQVFDHFIGIGEIDRVQKANLFESILLFLAAEHDFLGIENNRRFPLAIGSHILDDRFEQSHSTLAKGLWIDVFAMQAANEDHIVAIHE